MQPLMSALQDRRFAMRTRAGLARGSQLSEAQVETELAMLVADGTVLEVRSVNRHTGAPQLLYGLAERVQAYFWRRMVRAVEAQRRAQQEQVDDDEPWRDES